MKKQVINVIIAFLLAFMPVGSNYGTNQHVNPSLPTIVTSLVNTTSCQDVEFDADIAVTNFINVGSVSLALNYDVTKLTFLGYENLNSALEGGSLFVDARNGIVYVSWMSIAGATIGSGILMSLKFSGIAGSGSLTWYTSRCEYANVLGIVFPDAYQNGLVTIYAAPDITRQPLNVTVCEGSSTSFSVETEGQNLTFQWCVSEDGGVSWTALESGTLYAGVKTETLLVNTTTFDMNGYLYRCEVNGSCGVTYSNSAMLTVNFVDFAQISNLSQGWNWWSTYVEITLDDLKAALVEALPGTNITIKSRTQNTAYNPNTNRWMGTLASLDVTQMYMIYVSANCEITLSGASINPTEHSVTVSNGSNWIAFPLGESMSVSDAFAGFAVNGDKVKSRNNNTQYLGGSWRGQLTTLVPGQGYIYISNTQETRTLTFPANTK